jgi:predicted ArsR family transcriptional regulator
MSNTNETLKQPQTTRQIDSIEALKIYCDDVRLRMLNLMADAPRTVNELAGILNVPFTRLYYHMHLLEKHGFIEVVSVRNISGAVEEKHYQTTARTFTVALPLLTLGTPNPEVTRVQEVLRDAQNGLLNDPDHTLEEADIQLAHLKTNALQERLAALMSEHAEDNDAPHTLVVSVYRKPR